MALCVQVTCVVAVMELVRSCEGPGLFSGALYARLLTSVLKSNAVKPEVRQPHWRLRSAGLLYATTIFGRAGWHTGGQGCGTQEGWAMTHRGAGLYSARSWQAFL